MATMSTFIRRTLCHLSPLATRPMRAPLCRIPSPIVSSIHVHALPLLSRSFSTANRPTADENLIRVILSEIKCAEESDDNNKEVEKAQDFPFSIEDNPGMQIITLKREYQGEKIEVVVHMPSLVTGEEERGDAEDSDGGENRNEVTLPLIVSISKNGGPFLEFGCTAYPDEVTIDNVSLKNPDFSDDRMPYEGPELDELDENLQRAFHKYLEIRGIKASTTNFLHEYMINKDSREYTSWLNNLKDFIQA